MTHCRVHTYIAQYNTQAVRKYATPNMSHPYRYHNIIIA